MIELIVLALAMLAVASAYDIKGRYIPDYASYSFVAIAIIARILFSQDTANALLIGAILFGLGYALYKTGIWGGGDVKILASIAILLGMPLAIDFVTNLLIIGGLYSLIITIIIAIKNKHALKTKEKIYVLISISALALLLIDVSLISAMLVLCIIISAFMPYLKRIETELFIKTANIKTLMDGDWIQDEVRVGKQVIKPKKEGLSKEEAQQIKKWYATGKLKKLPRIKEGLPYLPAFLITLIITIILKNYGIENILIAMITR